MAESGIGMNIIDSRIVEFVDGYTLECDEGSYTPTSHEQMLIEDALRGFVDDSFQDRVRQWMLKCFDPKAIDDVSTRNYRFLEEALELVQACGCSVHDAHRLVDYVFTRPAGDPVQETGGVMVTLAAHSCAMRINMNAAGEHELARIEDPEVTEKIRQKQATKPKGSPLPMNPYGYQPTMIVLYEIERERIRQISEEGWTPERDDEQHQHGSLARAAACYATHAADCTAHGKELISEDSPHDWPWDEAWWKPNGKRRDLVRAGALIVAEIERLDRKVGE